MDRKRAAVAAGGVAVVLVVGSAAFAVGSGAFAANPVDRVGSFQSIEAGLVARAEPTSIPTVSATARDAGTAPQPSESSVR